MNGRCSTQQNSAADKSNEMLTRLRARTCFAYVFLYIVYIRAFSTQEVCVPLPGSQVYRRTNSLNYTRIRQAASRRTAA